MLQLSKHYADLCRRKRAILDCERGDRRRPNIVCWIGNLLAVKDSEAVDLLDDVADVNSSCWRASVFHFDTERSQITWGDLGQKTIPPDRQDIAVENGAAHGLGTVRHRRLRKPTLTEFAEALGLLQPALLALFFLRRRLSLR